MTSTGKSLCMTLGTSVEPGRGSAMRLTGAQLGVTAEGFYVDGRGTCSAMTKCSAGVPVESTAPQEHILESRGRGHMFEGSDTLLHTGQ